MERAAERWRTFLAAPMGEGTLAGLLVEGAGELAGFMAQAADILKASPVVHAAGTSQR